MATAVQIQVTVDESGVVQGVKAVSGTLDGLKKPAQAFGDTSNRVFEQTRKRANDAREAAMLLGNAIGVQLPSALVKVMSKLPGLSTAMASAFSVSFIAAFAVAIMSAVNNLDVLEKKWLSLQESAGAAVQHIASWFTGNRGWAQIAKEQDDARKASEAMYEQLRSNSRTAALAGKEGFAALHEGYVQNIADLDALKTKQMKAAHDLWASDSGTFAAAEQQIQSAYSKNVLMLKEAYDAQAKDLERKAQDAERQRQAEIRQIGLDPFNAAYAQQAADQAGIPSIVRASMGDAQQLDRDAEAKRNATILKMRRDWADQMSQVTREANSAQADGFLRSTLDTQNKIADLNKEFRDKWGDTPIGDPKDKKFQELMEQWVNASGDLARAITATEKAGIEERQKLQRENTEATVQMETRAAEATLPPWQRAAAGIRDSYQQALRQIGQDLNDHRITEEDALRRRNAAWQEMNGQLADDWRAKTDEMAGELESLFSGNILDNIKNRFKHMFFEIAAQALLSFSGIQQAIYGGSPAGGGATSSGGGGGLFGGILGGILGGRWGSGGGGGGVITTPPFNPNAGSGFDLGSLSGMTGSLYGGGLRDNVTGDVGALTMNPMIAGISAGAGTGMMAQSQANQAAVANTLSGSVLQSILGKVFTHGISLGKFSLSGSQLGSLGVGLGLTSIMGAYGSGSKTLGLVGGAAGGAMAGFSFGGPIGGVIGAAIGGLAGLFSGIFGGKKKHDQAMQLSYQVIDQITQAQGAYMSHQTDYASAIQALEQLRQQASQPFWQLGKQGKDVWWKSVYWRIDDAEKQINDVEKIRQQRSSINFAPTQFHDGGLIGPSDGLRLPNGDVLIRAKVGETVMNEAATQKYSSKLDAMNSGASSGGGDTYIIHAVDAKSFYSMLRDGGIRVVKQAWAADSTEYAGGGL